MARILGEDDEHRQTKRSYTEVIKEDRPRGRSKKRWGDNLEEDIRALGIDR